MATLSGAAWVTGAGSGIGRACAIALAGAGAKVALTGRRVDALEETAATILAAGGTALVRARRCRGCASRHFRASKNRRRARRSPRPRQQRGRQHAPAPLGAASPQDMSDVVDLDLKAMFYCTLAVLPAMRARGDGRIVHIASQAAVGLHPVSGPTYAAAKKGVLALSATLNAEEGIHGIRSICISPGEVDTPILFTRPAPPSAAERELMLKPEDVAETALFCGDAAAKGLCHRTCPCLPTDDRHMRAQANAIKGLTGAR